MKRLDADEISVTAAAERRGSASVFLDVREADELRRCRIDNAIHIPMNDVPARMSELDHSHELIVFCHHGTRSLMVVRFLKQHGFENVRSMAGGIEAWSVEIDPSVPRY